MRRTPLQRRTRLRAKRWGIRPRRPRRLDRPQSDPARLAWVRSQPCSVREAWMMGRLAVCAGLTEACHEGRKPGMAMKCPDAETLPMCQLHHRHWTDHAGVFAGWTGDDRRAWADERIADTTARYLSHGSRRLG